VKRPVLIVLSLVAPLLVGCDTGTEDARDVSSTRVVMRPHVPVPAGTVPRGASAHEAALAAPGPPATPELLQRGRERFAIFCSPCHGASGTGDGIVVDRGFPRPPDYHQDRQRDLSPEHIVSVITNGVGTMYPFAERIPPEDRWAIAHYVKARQAEGAPDTPKAPLP
jgi:mono/diheme cytochrome c family protein